MPNIDYMVHSIERQPHARGVETRFRAEQILYTADGTWWDPETATLDAGTVIEMLEADAITGLSDGDDITTWAATIGTNGTGPTSLKPSYHTGVKNGLPVARFSSDALQITGLTQASGDYSFFVVCESDNTGSGANEYMFDTQTGRLVLVHRTTTSGNVQFFDGAFRDTTTASTAAWQVLGFVLDNAGSTVYRNGTAIGSGLAYTQRAIGGGVAIGSDYTTGTARWAGDLAEFIIVNAAVGSDDRYRFDGYLHHKWGLESLLPVTHRYRYAPPTNG